MLFGGSGTSAKCFDDLQILDRHEMIWLDVTQNEAISDAKVCGNSGQYECDRDDSSFRMFGSEYIYANRQQHLQPQQYAGGPQHDDGLSMRRAYSDELPDAMGSSRRHQQGGTVHPGYSNSRADWRSRDMSGQVRHAAASVQSMHVSPNPNDEDSVPTVLIHGRGPGRRAGHTATAVNRKIYIFGGSCGAYNYTCLFCCRLYICIVAF
jgi:hypothetical protein